MHAPIQQPATKGSFENDIKLEQPPQSSTESANTLDHVSSSPPDKFDPGWRFYASFISLCIITLAVALDATSLSVALPVMNPSPSISCFTKFLKVLDRRGVLQSSEELQIN